MSGNTKMREDLDYVRRAIERQQNLIRCYLPIWFAAAVGAYLVAIGLVRDITQLGLISAGLGDAIGNYSLIIVFALLIALFARQRRVADKGGPANLIREEWKTSKLFVIQFVLILLGIALTKWALGDTGLAPDATKTVVLVQMGVGFAIMGLQGLRMILGFGIGAILGSLPHLISDFPFDRSTAALAIAVGVVIGAWRDHAESAARQIQN